MGGLIQPSANPTAEREESRLRPVLIGVVIVGMVVGLIVLAFRAEAPKPVGPPAYAANLKFSDLKVSAAQNFVGATVSYLDGALTNTADKTVIHAVVQVTFKDDIGQVVQKEEMPVHVLQTGGPYDEAVDLSVSPLGPGQTKPFRLTFESISAQWNHSYPDLKITDVRVK
jgi:hypothetical protein